MNRLNDVGAVLADGGQIAAQGTEGVRPQTSAEGARNLGFELDHANIAFGLVVVKRDAEVVHEGQRLGFVLGKAVQQVAGWRLFLAPTPGHQWPFWEWISGSAVLEDGSIAALVVGGRAAGSSTLGEQPRPRL